MHSTVSVPLLVGAVNRSWETVAFGDVVQQGKDSVDPATSGLERYVAGEHMDTDDLRIQRWGVIGDGYLGPAFHRLFRVRDVLYGSRRTYLRKVAVADFDGVCANTTFVCRPATERLLREFLPLVMQTETFHANSIAKSKGSVNPYINWSDIASFQFRLPPVDEQRRISQLVRAADEALYTYERVAACARVAVGAFLDALLTGDRWPARACLDVLDGRPRNGLSVVGNDERRGLPTLSIGAIQGGHVVPEGYTKYAEVEPQTVERFLLREGDVLVVRGNGNRDLTGRCGLVSKVPEGCFYPDLLIRLVFDPNAMRPEFGALQWNSPSVQQELKKRAKSTNGIWKVNGKDIARQVLRVPPVPVQEDFLKRVRHVQVLEEQAHERLEDSRGLRMALLNGLVGSA